MAALVGAMIPEEDLSAMEHDSEELSSSESRFEGAHPPPLRMPAASITAEEEEGDEDEESLADSNSRSGSTDTLCSVGRGGGHPSRPPPEDEIKVLKIVLRRRPLDLKQYHMLTAGGGGGRMGGRALWLTTTADGRTVARIQPRFLRQAVASRYGGQSVRAGVIHHSSNPDRHLTYYYLPKNGSLCQSSSSSSGSISEGLA